VENAEPANKPPPAFSTSRREILVIFIESLIDLGRPVLAGFALTFAYFIPRATRKSMSRGSLRLARCH
jgi:hypothetical protein